MSATPDNTFADSEQLITDLKRQLAECRAERGEALQQETATAETLQVINSSPGDRTPESVSFRASGSTRVLDERPRSPCSE
jgi:hypothetical protein